MFVVPTVALLLIAAPDDAYALKWKLKEGDVFYNTTTTVTDQKIEVMGKLTEQKSETKTVLKFHVTSIKKGITVVEMTYLENKSDSGLPGVHVADKMKNVTFTATFNDKMELTKLEGYDKFLDAVSDGDDAQKKLMKTMMPETAVRRTLEQTFAIGPDKPVAIGDDWTRTDKLSLGPLGSVETKSTFKLDAVKGDVVLISVKGDLTYKPGDGGDSGLPFKITKATLKAEKCTGTNLFDVKTGRITESRLDLETSGTMSLSLAGQTIDAKLKVYVKTVAVITEKNPIAN